MRRRFLNDSGPRDCTLRRAWGRRLPQASTVQLQLAPFTPRCTPMIRKLLVCFAASISAPATALADIVLDWNQTLQDVIQHDGTHPVHSANPGVSTRSIAMMNTAIYDTFQAINRTHQPYLFTQLAQPNTDLHAAVNEVAYQVLKNCYPVEVAGAGGIQAAYDARMALIAPGAAKDNGVALGQLIAQGCITSRTVPPDGSDPASWLPYTVQDGAGKWRPQPGQTAWGPGWGTVTSFGTPSSVMQTYVDDLAGPPSLTSQVYTDAFNQVKDYGSLTSAVRTQKMTETGLFWAYDRPSMGPPPVLFMHNITQVAEQIGSPEAANARLFAIASVAQADAAVAAW